MRAEFIVTSVFEDLKVNLSVEDTDSAVAPCLCPLEFREEASGSYHSLSLEKQMVSMLGVVCQDVFCVFVVVYKKLCKEFRCEGRRIHEKHEHVRLLSQSVAYLERTP